MPPPRRPELSIQDHEYAIRALTVAVAELNKQAEENEKTSRQAREDLLVIKTKIAFVAGGAGLVGGAIVAAVVKLLTHS